MRQIDRMSVEIYDKGIKCRLKKNKEFEYGKKGEGSKREKITVFSKKSKKRLAWIYSQGDWCQMMTLTYHRSFPDFETGKNHLSVVKKTLNRMSVKWLWVVEFQGRGFPHYHVWLDRKLEESEKKRVIDSWLCATDQVFDDDAERFHRHEKIFTDWNVELGINYAVKYAEKQEQKYLPVGIESYGRWWGSNKEILPEKGGELTIEKDGVTEVESVKFRRQVKRAIWHWKGKKRKTLFDKQTNSGFTFILRESRKKAIERIYENFLLEIGVRRNV